MDRQHIKISAEDPLSIDADGLIHPTTGAEAPCGERLPTFYERVGEDVLSKLKRDQPIRIGESTSTDGGNLPFHTIVHIPVRTAPDVPTTHENLQTALRTGLVGIDIDDVTTAVLPGLVDSNGTETDFKTLARTIVHDLVQYPPAHLEKICLVDENEDWIGYLKDAIQDE